MHRRPGRGVLSPPTCPHPTQWATLHTPRGPADLLAHADYSARMQPSSRTVTRPREVPCLASSSPDPGRPPVEPITRRPPGRPRHRGSPPVAVAGRPALGRQVRLVHAARVVPHRGPGAGPAGRRSGPWGVLRGAWAGVLQPVAGRPRRGPEGPQRGSAGVRGHACGPGQAGCGRAEACEQAPVAPDAPGRSARVGVQGVP
jgi:hypothetical protein